MIYLDITGRCGNQMFQYAFARKISILNNNEDISIDFYKVYAEGNRLNNNTFRNELSNFQAESYFSIISEGDNKIYRYGSKTQLNIFRVYKKLKRMLKLFPKNKRIAERIMYPLLCHYGIYWYCAPKMLKPCKQKNKFIFGYFENPCYFNDIKDILVSDFTPKNPAKKSNELLYKNIKDNQSVCVSIRYWQNASDRFLDIWEVCGKNYFENAFKIIQEKIPHAQFIIFSNDVEWVKQNFDLPKNCLFESGNDTIYEKIRLMSSCKHFIISNSTFSWWAQFLGKYEDKIVVSPEYWWNDEKHPYPLIQDSFIKIRRQ